MDDAKHNAEADDDKDQTGNKHIAPILFKRKTDKCKQYSYDGSKHKDDDSGE